MSISRSLCLLAALFSAAATLTPRNAAAQDQASQSTTLALSRSSTTSLVTWTFDANYSAARRMGTTTGCDQVYVEAREQGAAATCSSNSRMQSWNVDGGLIFRRVIGFRIGYAEYGKVALESDGRVSFTVTPPTGVRAATMNFNATYSERDEFGRSRGITLAAVARAPLGRVVPFGELGLWRWSALSTARIGYATSNGGVVVDSGFFDERQTHSSWDPILGGGAELWLSHTIGLNAGVRLVRLQTTGDEIDEKFTTYFLGLKIGRQ